jgi:TctA family transporter
MSDTAGRTFQRPPKRDQLENKQMKTSSATLLSGAVSGIVLGLAATAGASNSSETAVAFTEATVASPQGDMADAGAKHACKGQNACKGQGGCKTDKHSCKGQNACKGQGGCKT